MKLDLSIVIACYNCADTLERCLNSIPKNAGIEIILVDDHSLDQTASIIEKYTEMHKKETIISVFNNENYGAGRTRNIGIGKATKQYITFLDADDELSGIFLSEIIKTIDKGYDCIVFDATQVKNANESLIKMFYTKAIHEGVIDQKEALVYIRGATWGKIYNRNIISSNNVLFGDIKRNEDMIFTKIALANCKSIYYIEKPLYKYIDNDSSLMHNNSLRTEKNAIIAVATIRKVLLEKGFSVEFNSIYFLEILYSTTLTLIVLGKTKEECKKHFKKMAEYYDTKDPYRKRYYLKYRIAYYLFMSGMFDMLRFILRK